MKRVCSPNTHQHDVHFVLLLYPGADRWSQRQAVVNDLKSSRSISSKAEDEGLPAFSPTPEYIARYLEARNVKPFVCHCSAAVPTKTKDTYTHNKKSKFNPYSNHSATEDSTSMGDSAVGVLDTKDWLLDGEYERVEEEVDDFIMIELEDAAVFW